MTHSRSRAVPLSPVSQDAPPAPEIIEHKRRRWSTDVQSTFLRALAKTHCVAKAARVAGVSRSSAYRVRAELKGEAFDLAWQAALTCGLDALADTALERAINGVEVPHFYKGELIHTSRKYDERLTIALLAMRERMRPTYIPQSHPASAYTPDGLGSEFGDLLSRIDAGLERWTDDWP
jgi:hypothetical protein